MTMSTLVKTLIFVNFLKSFTSPPPQRRHASSSCSRSTWQSNKIPRHGTFVYIYMSYFFTIANE
jgi:hypothetical protein